MVPVRCLGVAAWGTKLRWMKSERKSGMVDGCVHGWGDGLGWWYSSDSYLSTQRYSELVRFLSSLGKFFRPKLLNLKYECESPEIMFKYRFPSVRSGQGGESTHLRSFRSEPHFREQG